MRNGPIMSTLLLLSRIVVGGMIVYAAVLKLPKPNVFHDSVKAYRLLPEHLEIVSAYAFPWLELIAGVCLVLGVWARAAATIAAMLLVGFIVAIASVMIRADVDVPECGCFGDSAIKICTGPPGWCHIAQNSVLTLLSLFVLIRGAGRISIDDLRTPATRGKPADLLGSNS